MARNFYFSPKVRSEMELYENLVIEAMQIYGQDVYYLPRDLVNYDTVFGADPESSFNSSYKIEMYIDNTEGFDGEGDLFTRFGVEIRDEATFIVSRRRWAAQVARYDNELLAQRPVEGDVIYLPLTKKMFQIMHVEHEQPFYQIEDIPVYKLRAQLFEYTGEDFDTGVADIDGIETTSTYQYELCLKAPKKPVFNVTMANDSNYVAFGYSAVNYVNQSPGRIKQITILDGGTYFNVQPTITIDGFATDSATATVTIGNGGVNTITITDSGNGYNSIPVVNVVGGSTVDSDYRIGDNIYQLLSNGTKMKGEVVRYKLDSAGDSCRRLYLTHVGAEDGKFRNFISGDSNGTQIINTSRGTGLLGLTVQSVVELNKVSENEQNDDFSTVSDDFLDFSETNPFGDPENQ